MNIDETMQNALKLLNSKSTLWKDYKTTNRFSYIYCENEIYVIKDNESDVYSIVKATNPIYALSNAISPLLASDLNKYVEVLHQYIAKIHNENYSLKQEKLTDIALKEYESYTKQEQN